ncbi:MAG: DUF2142 domain-containing protein [Desulfobacterales bacterium]|nr:DUF2142 domain-containing protein [Desulfobacterales bacterium]
MNTKGERVFDAEAPRTILLYSRMIMLFVCGCIYVFLIPPFEAPDEPSHFLRAHGVMEGQFILKNHSGKLVHFVHENMKARHADNPWVLHVERLLNEPGDRKPNIAWNTALYSPVPYLFHTGVIKMVMAFSQSSQGFRVALYLCRLTTLCLFVFFVFLASRINPESSWLLYWVASAPMALSQACVVNIDFIIFGACAILLSASLGNISERKYAACLILSSFFLLMSKPTYFPLLLIPVISAIRRRTGGQHGYTAPFVWGLALSVSGAVAWNWFVKSQGAFISLAEEMKRFTGLELNPSFQLEFILQSPMEFVYIIKNTLVTSGVLLMHQFVGVLGWLDAPIPFFMVVLWWIFTIPAILISGFPPMPRMKELALSLEYIFIACTIFFLIFISAFMLWMPVGSTWIGVQGRYFHTLVLILFFGLIPWTRLNIRNWGKRVLGCLLIVVSLMINIASFTTIYYKYWGD